VAAWPEPVRAALRAGGRAWPRGSLPWGSAAACRKGWFACGCLPAAELGRSCERLGRSSGQSLLRRLVLVVFDALLVTVCIPCSVSTKTSLDGFWRLWLAVFCVG